MNCENYCNFVMAFSVATMVMKLASKYSTQNEL